MAISAQNIRATYVGDGISVNFPLAARTIDAASIIVSVNGSIKTLGFDYTISGIGANSGITVAFATAPIVASSVAILRKGIFVQNTTLVDNEVLPAQTWQDTIDRLEVETQFLLNSAYLVPDNSGLSGSASLIALNTAISAEATRATNAEAALAAGIIAGFNPASIIGNVTLNVGPGQTYTSLAAALTFLQGYRIPPTATVTIQIIGHVAAAAGFGTWTHPDSRRILIRGSAPIALTWGGITSSTGAKGARSVTYTLTGATVNVGDVVLISNSPQGLPSQNVGSGPVQGMCSYGLSHTTGQLSLSCVAQTNIATLSPNVGGLGVGDIIVAQGQIRKVTGINTPSAGQITVNTNFLQTCNGLVYWGWFKAEAGTITVAAGIVTGDGSTTFDTRINATGGDLLLPADGSDTPIIIQSVAGAHAMTLERSVTIAAGTSFAVVNAAWLHEGAWKAIAVAGSAVTLLNTTWSDYRPPTIGVTAPTVRLLTSTLTSTAGGFTLNADSLDIDQCALIGPFTPNQGDGVTTDGLSPALFKLGSAGAIMGFDAGVRCYGPSHFYGNGSFLCGNNFAGLYQEGGRSYINTAYVNGNGTVAKGGYGVVFDGGHVYGSRMRGCGNYEDAIRTDAGGFVYIDWGVFNGNGGRSFQWIDISGGHAVGCQFIFNGWNFAAGTSGGINLQNGARGRFSGAVVLCNDGPGLSGSNAGGEATWLWTAGNAGNGVDLTASSGISLELLASCGNAGIGLNIANSSTADAKGAYSVNNSSYGVRATFNSSLNVDSISSSGNGATYDISADPTSVVDWRNAVGTVRVNAPSPVIVSPYIKFGLLPENVDANTMRFYNGMMSAPGGAPNVVAATPAVGSPGYYTVYVPNVGIGGRDTGTLASLNNQTVYFFLAPHDTDPTQNGIIASLQASTSLVTMPTGYSRTNLMRIPFSTVYRTSGGFQAFHMQGGQPWTVHLTGWDTGGSWNLTGADNTAGTGTYNDVNASLWAPNNGRLLKIHAKIVSTTGTGPIYVSTPGIVDDKMIAYMNTAGQTLITEFKIRASSLGIFQAQAPANITISFVLVEYTMSDDC